MKRLIDPAKRATPSGVIRSDGCAGPSHLFTAAFHPVFGKLYYWLIMSQKAVCALQAATAWDIHAFASVELLEHA